MLFVDDDAMCCAEHDGAVTAVDIASDGVKILAGTASVSLSKSLSSEYTD